MSPLPLSLCNFDTSARDSAPWATLRIVTLCVEYRAGRRAGRDFVSIIDVDVGNWHILRRAALLRIYRIYDTFAYIERRPFLHYYQDQWLCTPIDIRNTLVVRLPAVGWEVLTLLRDVGNGSMLRDAGRSEVTQ